MVFTKWTLVLKVQLCSTLRVQSSEHLDEDILQDCRAWVGTHADVEMMKTVTLCGQVTIIAHVNTSDVVIYVLPSSGLSSRLMRMRNGLRSCMRTLSSSPPRALPCKIPTIACKHTETSTRIHYCKHHRPLFSGAISAQRREHNFITLFV